MWLSFREVQCELLGFCVPWGNRVSGAPQRVAGFSFPPLVWNLAFLLFDKGARALLLSGTVGSTGPPCSVGRKDFWCQQISKAWSMVFPWVCDRRLLVLCSKLRVPMGQQGQQAWIIWCPPGISGPGIYLCWGMGIQEPQQLQLV
jgi:hypothetical protein